jgi:hypothetical protein
MTTRNVAGWESAGEIIGRLAMEVARREEAAPPVRARRWSRPVWKRDPLRDGFIVAAVLWVLAMAAGVISTGVDAQNFYDHLGDPYAVHDYAAGQGFYYAPPVALAMRVLMPLGPHIFSAVIVALGFVALGWIGGRWAWLLLFFPPVWWDISSGNVNTVIGALSIAILARPGWIAVPLLTKVTPGVIALWWIVRREWAQAARAALVVGLICLVSLVIVPLWWRDWIVGLLSNGTGYVGPGYFTVPIPLIPRLAVATGLVVFGARTNRQWVLPVAACLALPVLWWSGLAALVGILRAKR